MFVVRSSPRSSLAGFASALKRLRIRAFKAAWRRQTVARETLPAGFRAVIQGHDLAPKTL